MPWLGSGRSDSSSRVISSSRVLHEGLVAPEGMAFGDTFELGPDDRRVRFGDTVSIDDHAERAVRLALELRDAMERL